MREKIKKLIAEIEEEKLFYLAKAHTLEKCIYGLQHQEKIAWKKEDPLHRKLRWEDKRTEDYMPGITHDMARIHFTVSYPDYAREITSEKSQTIYAEAAAELIGKNEKIKEYLLTYAKIVELNARYAPLADYISVLYTPDKMDIKDET